jgi:uncharacterized protein (TIGR01244 family)
MDYLREVNDRYSVSLSQFNIEDFEALAGSGYSSVVDVRTPEESEQSADLALERDAATKAGMAYAHIPVSSDQLDDSVVNAFRECISGLKGKVLIHGDSDDRSAALTLMHLAAEKGLTGEEALQRARELGIAQDDPRLTQFVEHYVNRNSVDIHYV